MSELPPAPGEDRAEVPQPAKKDKSWRGGIVLLVIGVGLSGLAYLGVTAGSEPTLQEKLDQGALIITEGIENDEFEAGIAEAERLTGCQAVSGGRMSVDPNDPAAVAEEARARANYVKQVEATSGLDTGHATLVLPDGNILHQVVVWDCPEEVSSEG